MAGLDLVWPWTYPAAEWYLRSMPVGQFESTNTCCKGEAGLARGMDTSLAQCRAPHPVGWGWSLIWSSTSSREKGSVTKGTVDGWGWGIHEGRVKDF